MKNKCKRCGRKINKQLDDDRPCRRCRRALKNAEYAEQDKLMETIKGIASFAGRA